MLTTVHVSEVMSDTCILEWLNRCGVGLENLAEHAAGVFHVVSYFSIN
jgi:hypothetical protein